MTKEQFDNRFHFLFIGSMSDLLHNNFLALDSTNMTMFKLISELARNYNECKEEDKFIESKKIEKWNNNKNVLDMFDSQKNEEMRKNISILKSFITRQFQNFDRHGNVSEISIEDINFGIEFILNGIKLDKQCEVLFMNKPNLLEDETEWKINQLHLEKAIFRLYLNSVSRKANNLYIDLDYVDPDNSLKGLKLMVSDDGSGANNQQLIKFIKSFGFYVYYYKSLNKTDKKTYIQIILKEKTN